MISKDGAYKTIEELVTRFAEQYGFYKLSDYNETLTRRDFIDPFFKALGWDIDNSKGNAEAYREVIHEERVKVGKATKAPDYTFRLEGGKRLFFVEAKKPGIDIKDDVSVAYQIRRYGWSARLPVSIITDFEEFAVYDCSKKPKPSDKASVARIKYLRFTEYLKEFDYLWDTFSKEKVLKGSFDRFVQSDTAKKGTATVDREFLASLDNWRTFLATGFSLRNKHLNEDEISYVVQLTIDRLIFLRIAEDREVEPYGQLKNAVTRKGESYLNLFEVFRKADAKYNSGLFDFRKDLISETLQIDNKVIKTLVSEMYYPESPYEFSVIPVEILGSAYEQFLGKQIRIDKAHRAKIELKPEVRKAGGVYYTPQFIVDYIVKNTVGKLIEGKTPKQIESVKILDPACGSGSFLLGAYQYLLDYHKAYYSSKGVKTGKRESPLTPSGELTSAEKKRILLNNIFGVDIDVNAVEVTKLSLLLKCMEGETSTSIAQQQQLWHERILPTLDENIKSGNSLVDVDFYAGIIDFDTNLEKKIKPFDWVKSFPDVFKQRESIITTDLKERFQKIKNQTETNDMEANLLMEKYLKKAEEPTSLYGNDTGFDIIIGNPPYFSVSSLEKELQTYLYKKYTVYERTTDIYCLFFEKALKILRSSGIVSFITSNQWLQTNYGRILRQYLVENSNPELLINFGGLKIFEDATVDTSILLIRKTSFQNILEACQFKSDFDKDSGIEDYFQRNKVVLTSLKNDRWIIAREPEISLKEKIRQNSNDLANLNVRINYGIKSGLNEAFIIDTATREKLICEDKNAEKIIKPLLRGRDVHQFNAKWAGLWLIVTRNGIDIKSYPSIIKHLSRFADKLKKRTDKGENWWNLRACNYYDLFEQPKIIYPETTVRRSEFFIDRQGFYLDKTCFMITGENLEYLTGIFTSKLIEWYLESELRLLGKRSIQYSKQFIERIPIAKTNDSNQHLAHEIVKSVNILTKISNDLSFVKLPDQKQQIQSRLDYTYEHLNNTVYELYGLTENEIKIVEGK